MSVVPWARRRRRVVLAAPTPPGWERLCRDAVRADVGRRVAPVIRPGAVVVVVLVSREGVGVRR